MFEILKRQGLVMSIALSDIVPNPAQPRRNFDESELFALGESIRENGLIQPISVRKTKSGFELIAGERRFRACKLIGRQKIEAIVYDIGDEVSAVWALIENLQRSDLSPFEEAEALLKQSNEAAVEAHHMQTELLIGEANGNKTPVDVLLVHAQDHLMTSMLAVELIKELIDIYKNKN